MSAAIEWQKSSFSGEGPQCVEVAIHNGEILIRESDAPDTIVVTDRAKLRAFIGAVKAGEFDHVVG